jgi:hypothetical protein
MEDPTVNVKYSEYQKLRDELEAQVTSGQLADPTGTTKLLHDGFHAAIKVVQFAVGNLAPETVAGWPHEALVEIADAIDKIPGMDQHVKELPPELRHFAKLTAGYETYRKERDKSRVVTVATAEDFGPKTAEAAAVHASHTRSSAEKPPEPTTSDEASQR